MKIGFISTYFYPVKGGAENNCFYLAKELGKKHEVHVFTSHKGEFKHYEVIEGIHVHRSREIFRFGYYAAFYPGMLFQVLNTKLDVLHVHSFGFLWHDLIVLMKKLFNPKLKLIITPHGPFMALDNYPLYAKIYKKVVNFLEFNLNKIYSVVIQVNPSQKDWLVNYGFKENNIRYLPNGISKQLFSKVNNYDIVKKYNLKNKIVLSFVGRLQEYKGLDQVIRVLPKLDKNIVFVIFGFGNDKQRLFNIAKQFKVDNRIVFIHGNDLIRNKVLKSSDIFVFPSKWEAFGLVVLEAMAFGNAIVSSRTEGGKFLVKENVNGFLFDFGNLDELESKLKLLIKNKNLRSKISKNNIKKSKEFLWENIAKDLEEIYSK